MDLRPEDPLHNGERDAFPETRWSLVARLNGEDKTAARVALEELCAQYRYPLYCLARRLGLSHFDAEDVLHDFLVKFLKNDSFARADAGRGRMRAFLGGSLRRMIYDWLRERCDEPLSLDSHPPDDLEESQERYNSETFADHDTPERIFERQWAIELVRAALDRTREHYESRGRGQIFATLLPCLLSGKTLRGLDVPALASSAGVTEANLRTCYSRLIEEYGANFRREVLHTVESVNDVDEEVEYLMSVLARN
jgi:RNA polymerase sigma-70 factor (ECF subfamily)